MTVAETLVALYKSLTYITWFIVETSIKLCSFVLTPGAVDWRGV